MSEPQYQEYNSYNGLDRTVLFMGVPLLWAVLLLVVSVVTMFLGMFAIDGLWGFLFALVWLPVGFFLRQISQTDDKALDMLKLEFIYRFKRRGYKEFGNTLTFVPERYMRYKPTNEQYFYNINETVKGRVVKD